MCPLDLQDSKYVPSVKTCLKRREQIHYCSQFVTWSGKGGQSTPLEEQWPLSSSPTKDLADLFEFQSTSFLTQRDGLYPGQKQPPAAPPPYPVKKKEWKKKKNADSLSPTVHFSILGRGQIGYGKLLSLPLSLLFTLSGSSLSPLLSCAWNKPRLTAVHLRHA